MTKGANQMIEVEQARDKLRQELQNCFVKELPKEDREFLALAIERLIDAKILEAAQTGASWTIDPTKGGE